MRSYLGKNRPCECPPCIKFWTSLGTTAVYRPVPKIWKSGFRTVLLLWVADSSGPLLPEALCLPLGEQHPFPYMCWLVWLVDLREYLRRLAICLKGGKTCASGTSLMWLPPLVPGSEVEWNIKHHVRPGCCLWGPGTDLDTPLLLSYTTFADCGGGLCVSGWLSCFLTPMPVTLDSKRSSLWTVILSVVGSLRCR